MTAHLEVLLPIPLTGRGPGYTCGMIAKHMAGPDLSVTVATPHARSYSIAPASIYPILPKAAGYIPYRWLQSHVEQYVEERFIAHVMQSRATPGAAYIWPDCSLSTVQALHAAGFKVIREMINCHRGTAKRILDDAYDRIGLSPRHGITERSIEAEQELLEEVDYIFSPNQSVVRSLREFGLGECKILPTSYGWDPKRLQVSVPSLPPCDGLTVLFVGTICVRKGAHLLLDYWAKSKVRGRLVLAGAMEDVIKEKCADLLSRDDVLVLDYVTNVSGLYHSADIFAFPSLEEGGPQVTYEAMGCGLPIISTVMGAGPAREGLDGFILDPYDQAGWVAALQMAAERKCLIRDMAESARAQAAFFHWDSIGRKRKGQLLACLT